MLRFRFARALGAWFLSLACVGVVTAATPNALPEMKTEKPEKKVVEPFRLMTKERDAAFRSVLPRVADKALQAKLDDPNLILYTDREMPKAYQDWSGNLPGVHSPSYNISADGGEPHGNGNIEFPWGKPAGTHRSKNVSSFRFLWLPRDAEGKVLPVVWFRRRLTGDYSQGYAWRFPVGTHIGEVLMVESPQKEKITFEVRVRIRERADWAVDVFRPFPTASDLAKRIKQLRPDWKQQPKAAKLVSHLSSPIKMVNHTLQDRHPRQSFHQKMGVDTLPAIKDDQLVAQLLKETTFRSSHGEVWRKTDKETASCAPTTKAGFHVIPANFDAGFIEVDRQSCMRCHKTVNKHVSTFQPGRDWYGRVRGSDGIFSFHPFSKSSISYNGYGNSVSMRSEMVKAGVLAQYQPKKHARASYTEIPHLKD